MHDFSDSLPYFVIFQLILIYLANLRNNLLFCKVTLWWEEMNLIGQFFVPGSLGCSSCYLKFIVMAQCMYVTFGNLIMKVKSTIAKTSDLLLLLVNFLHFRLRHWCCKIDSILFFFTQIWALFDYFGASSGGCHE